VEMIGNKRVQSPSKRWRDAYRKRGIAGLQDNRKDNSGRPSEKKLSAEEN
jgi:transposase